MAHYNALIGMVRGLGELWGLLPLACMSLFGLAAQGAFGENSEGALNREEAERLKQCTASISSGQPRHAWQPVLNFARTQLV